MRRAITIVLLLCLPLVVGLTPRQHRTLVQVVASRSGVSVAPTDPTLRVWYEFAADTGTNYVDSTTNSLTAYSSATAPSWTNGTLLLTASPATYIRANDNSAFEFGTNDFTLAIWAKQIDRAASRTLIAKYYSDVNKREYAWQVNTSGLLVFFTSANGTAVTSSTGTVAFATNTWIHLVAVKTGTDVAFYTNAIATPDSNTGNHGTIADNDSLFVVGAVNNGSTANWSGWIDDVRAYGKALSPTEITNLYNSTITTRP